MKTLLKLAVAPLVVMALAACSVSSIVPTFATRTTTTVPAGAPVAISSTAITNLQTQFVTVVKQVSPSIVQVQTPAGLGSGIVFDAQGDIVTNAHVVAGYTSFTVTTSTGAQYPATLVGTNPSQDLAVIHINATGLTPATFGDSSSLQVGDLVLALGSPYGLQGSVTQGLVSGLGRNIPESRSVTLQGMIQTSAPINPGNSGGALVDINGNVMGIPTLGTGAGDGVGFAISSNTVVSVANSLLKTS
jgi:S1-C subfamily serine protease